MARHVPSDVVSIILGKLPMLERSKQICFSKTEFSKFPKYMRILFLSRGLSGNKDRYIILDILYYGLFINAEIPYMVGVLRDLMVMVIDIRLKKLASNPYTFRGKEADWKRVLQIIAKLDWKELFLRYIHKNLNPCLTGVKFSHRLSEIYVNHMEDNCRNEYHPIYCPELSEYPDLAEKFVEYLCRDSQRYIKSLEYKNRIEYLNRFISLEYLWDRYIMVPSFDNWQLSGFMDFLVGSCSYPRIIMIIYNDADQKVVLAVWKSFPDTYKKLKEKITLEMILKAFAPKYRNDILKLKREI